MRTTGALLVALAGMLSCAATAQTMRLEAEDAQLSGPALKVVLGAEGRPGTRGGYSAKGYVTGFATQADRLTFRVTVAAGGVYDLRLGYGCQGHKEFGLDVDGLKLSGSFAGSGVGQFAMVSAGRVELQAGVNSIVVERGWGFYDIDYLEVMPSAAIVAPMRPPAGMSDPQANPAAEALLHRLGDVYGHGTMLGVYSDEDARYVLATTGFRPAIMGGDLSRYSPASLEHERAKPEGEIERLIARAGEGYVVTLSWHWIAPYGLIDAMLPGRNGSPPVDARWYKGFYTNATTFDLAAAMEHPESKEYAALVRDIDAIAVQLKRLDAAGIQVLWRPLHEAEGGWFWWGAKGPKPFVALWRLMHDRLVNVDGVHNLVWVYTSGGDAAWYPGDSYVDVVGIDAYPQDLRDPQTQLWQSLQQEFGGRKLLAVSEFGGVPDVERMQRLGAWWGYAVSWSGDLGPRKNDAADLKRIYGAEGAVKLGPESSVPRGVGQP